MTQLANDIELYGCMAEFTKPEELVDAARRAREAGYQRVEAYSPFPVHGINEALGLKPSVVPKLALIGGGCGAATALLLEYFCAAFHYPLNIGGRPLNSWPSFFPVLFELTVLGASSFAFFGMLIINGLPRPYHPLFNVPEFKLAQRDRFFLVIEADDAKFERAATRAFLEQLPTQAVYDVPE
jgi:Protein of unknown function (DUF3341)